MADSPRSKVLVTGGAGYIGSHTAVALHEAGFMPVLVDNLHNSKASAVDGVRAIVGDDVPFEALDICNKTGLEELFGRHDFVGVLHFAAHKAVGESMAKPAMYAANNVGGLGVLLEVASAHDVDNIVFSSSCTVYGEPEDMPVAESAPFQRAESPYGWTKQACERVLEDHAAACGAAHVALLRYFNPIGAHPSAHIGELPLGVPNNLIPFLTQAVSGIRKALTVFGGDYDTPDGTCIRDYLHVMDLAEAHVAALQWCLDQPTTGRSSVRSTWAQGKALQCWKSSKASNAPPDKRCPTPWAKDVKATSWRFGRTRLGRRMNSDGAPLEASKRRWPTHGAGKRS